MNTTQTAAFGKLIDYRTCETLRDATEEERDLSRDAATRDGGRGVIRAKVSLFGRTVTAFVEE